MAEGAGPGKKTALVTGAGRGIGRAIALALAREAISVVLLARTKTEIESVSSEIALLGQQALPIVCDVTQPEQVAHAVDAAKERQGPITILVNNAGSSGSSKFLNHDDSLWHRMITTNLDSAYYVTKAVVPMMVNANWGRIINIASTASKTGGKYTAAYTASKHGVLGLTRALAAEFVSSHITVNAICPGYVETPMTERSVANIVERTKMDMPAARSFLENTNPQKRLITPDEVAALAMMLVSDDARGINGQAINIDGGALMY